jgi:hypothetical protein
MTISRNIVPASNLGSTITKEMETMAIRKPAFSLAVAVALLGIGAVATPASADLCISTASCTLTLDQGNSGSGFGTGNFGTVKLALAGTTATITVDLAAGFRIVNTGFPGAFGFADSLGGGLTIGNFSSALYSGFLSDATKISRISSVPKRGQG